MLNLPEQDECVIQFQQARPESSSEALQKNEKEKKVCYNNHYLDHANNKSAHITFKTVPAIMAQDYVV